MSGNMSETPVWIRDTWRAVPVFHFWERPSTAACGADLNEMRSVMPLKHAEKFARPCKRCLAAREEKP